jgi:hypothetical protein
VKRKPHDSNEKDEKLVPTPPEAKQAMDQRLLQVRSYTRWLEAQQRVIQRLADRKDADGA